MLPKAVAEIAKTLIKDGMKLDDAVLAAYRIMDEPVDDAVPTILARDKKFMDNYFEKEEMFKSYGMPREVVEDTANVLVGVKGTFRGLPNRAKPLIPQNAKEWREYAYQFKAGPPSLTPADRAYVARQYALRQLGLLD